MTQSRARESGPRRAMLWIDKAIESLLVANTITAIELSSDLPDDEFKGLTVTRTIIDLYIQSESASLTNLVGIGISVVSQEALSASALPEPSDDSDSALGWVFRTIVSTSTSSVADASQFTRLYRDIRGQRKFHSEDTTYCLLMQTDAAILNRKVMGMIRVLYKRP